MHAARCEWALHVRHMTCMPGRLTAKQHLSHAAQMAHSNDVLVWGPLHLQQQLAAGMQCQHREPMLTLQAGGLLRQSTACLPQRPRSTRTKAAQAAGAGRPPAAMARAARGAACRAVKRAPAPLRATIITLPKQPTTGVALCLSTRRATGATCVHPLPADPHAPCPWACSTHACSLANSCPARPARRLPSVAVCCRP